MKLEARLKYGSENPRAGLAPAPGAQQWVQEREAGDDSGDTEATGPVSVFNSLCGQSPAQCPAHDTHSLHACWVDE